MNGDMLRMAFVGLSSTEKKLAGDAKLAFSACPERRCAQCAHRRQPPIESERLSCRLTCPTPLPGALRKRARADQFSYIHTLGSRCDDPMHVGELKERPHTL